MASPAALKHVAASSTSSERPAVSGSGTERSGHRPACSEILPPPPPLRPGDRPQILASMEAQILPPRAKVSSGVPRLRSIIIAPVRKDDELSRRIPQDLGGKWQVVRPKFWWRKVNSSSSGARPAGRQQGNSWRGSAPESSRFKGLCFRCLSSFHFVRNCKGPVHCLVCKLPGHRARTCTARSPHSLRTPLASSSTPPRPSSVLLQANAAARAVRPTMAREPGHPSNRHEEVFSSSLSTPAMEMAASEMRRTHLAILLSDPRLNISTRSIAKVLQDKLEFHWEDIHVSASYPDDFLVRFAEPWQRDMALELGTLPLKRGTMALTTWSPTARGRPQTWRFYCRVAMENVPLNAWNDEATIKEVLGGTCELDKIERRSITRDNTAALFAWVWSLDPDLIPVVKSHSILNRPAERRESLPEGTPAEEGRDGPLYRILIHLDRVLDYTPMDESRRRRGYKWPQDFRKNWVFGIPDNKPGLRQHPARDWLGPSNHTRRHDNDKDYDRHDDRNRNSRNGDHRRGGRRGGDGGEAESSRWNSERRQQHQERHDRRSSRSPDYQRRGDYSRHRSRSPSAASLRDVQRITPAKDQVQTHQENCLTRPDQTVRPLLHVSASPLAGGRSRRSKSRTPEGSLAMGITPSPPGVLQREPSRSSPMKPSSPTVQPSFEGTVQYRLCSTGSGNAEHFINSLPPPPSPPINWAELPVTAQPLGEAQVFDDCWSANIAPAPMVELGAFFPASPQHLRSPLHLSPEHQMPA
ncbi:hypothetical protein ACQ4PT_047934 [Festuca glaucescens]